MIAVHVTVGVAVLTLNLAAGAWGAWCWWQVIPSERFWPLLRAAQGAAALQAVLGGLMLASGREPEGLHLLYGLLPIAVAFLAEQLRIASAQTILDARGLASSKDVGKLPEAEQRSIVLAIMRREIGVMTASALVIFFLALRAAQEAGFL